MDSKWGGKTETINMQLNVEQVCENLRMYCYHVNGQANYQLLSISDVRGHGLFFGSLQGPLVFARGLKILVT